MDNCPYETAYWQKTDADLEKLEAILAETDPADDDYEELISEWERLDAELNGPSWSRPDHTLSPYQRWAEEQAEWNE